MSWQLPRILLGIALGAGVFLTVAFLLGWLSEWIGNSFSPVATLIIINGGVLVLAGALFWLWRRYRRPSRRPQRERRDPAA